MSTPSIGTSAYNFFVKYLERTSRKLGRSGFPGFVWRGYKKDVKRALKESGFKVSGRVLDFREMRRGKWIATALFDAKFGNLRFHVHASILDYAGRFRIKPLAYGVTMIYVERIKPGILGKLVSALKRNFTATDTLAVRLVVAKEDIVKECSQRHRNACYFCEALRVDYSKYEHSTGGFTFFFDPLITGIFQSYSWSQFSAGAELVVNESVAISLEEIKELFNIVSE